MYSVYWSRAMQLKLPQNCFLSAFAASLPIPTIPQSLSLPSLSHPLSLFTLPSLVASVSLAGFWYLRRYLKWTTSPFSTKLTGVLQWVRCDFFIQRIASNHFDEKFWPIELWANCLPKHDILSPPRCGWITRSWHSLGLQCCVPLGATKKQQKRFLPCLNFYAGCWCWSRSLNTWWSRTFKRLTHTGLSGSPSTQTRYLIKLGESGGNKGFLISGAQGASYCWRTSNRAQVNSDS